MKKIWLLPMVLLSACTTILWQNSDYTESLTGFHVVEEKNLMIVSGKKYSYIFTVDSSFKSILKLSRSIEFNPRFTGFKIDSNHKVRGDIHFQTTKDLADAQALALTELGFIRNNYGSYTYSTTLAGSRYEVEGTLPFVLLEDPHQVVVEEPKSFVGTLGRIIATPVTLTVDAVGVIGVATVFTWIGVSQSISD